MEHNASQAKSNHFFLLHVILSFASVVCVCFPHCSHTCNFDLNTVLCRQSIVVVPSSDILKAGSLKMNTALEYSTRVVQEGRRRCKKSTLNDLVHLTPLRIPLMNPPLQYM